MTDIDQEPWRNTSWIQNISLPPRYGINTTNISESTNSMILEARKGTWLDAINTIIDICIRKISKLKNDYEGKEGVVPQCKSALRELYDQCVGYEITNIDTEKFKVQKFQGNVREIGNAHVLDWLYNPCGV